MQEPNKNGVAVMISFKSQLTLAVLLCSVGFSWLILTNGRALDRITSSTEATEEVAANQARLLQLKVAVLMESILVERDQKVSGLSTLIERFPLAEMPDMDSLSVSRLHELMQLWIDLHLSANQHNTTLGLTRESGLRGEAHDAITAIESNLFSMFHEAFAELKSSIDKAQDSMTLANLDSAIMMLEEFSAFVTEMEFTDLYETDLGKLRNSLQASREVRAELEHISLQLSQTQALLFSQLDQYLVATSDDLNLSRETAIAVSSRAKSTSVGVGASVGVFLVLALFSIRRRTVRFLKRTVATLEQIASGDLTKRLPVRQESNDEFDQLSDAVNQMAEEQLKMIRHFTETGDVVTHNSEILQHNCLALLTRSNEVNQDMVSITGHTQSINSTLADVMEEITSAYQESSGVSKAADSGVTTMQMLVESMANLKSIFSSIDDQASDVEQASAEVNKVTSMIDGIAEQTNMLALNAAIEAARAGEAGRGFSVVADEVRGLVDKTVVATNKINVIVTRMQMHLSTLIETMRKGIQVTDQSRIYTTQTDEEISSIQIAAKHMAERNRNLHDIIQQVVDKAQNIQNGTEQITQSSGENLHNVESLNQTSQEVLAQITAHQASFQRFKTS